MGNIDSETVFNALLAEGESVPIAYAASIDDSEPQPASVSNRRIFDLGLLAGLVLWLLWQLI